MKTTPNKNLFFALQRMFVFILLFGVSFNHYSQTNYRTSGNSTDWNNPSAWVNTVVPPNIIPEMDTVFIDHLLVNYSDINVIGTLIISSPGGLDMGTKQLDVGVGVVDKGSVINFGTFDAGNILISPSACTYPIGDTLPEFKNYNVVNLTTELDVGKDPVECGYFYNYTGAIFHAATAHIDSKLWNEGVMVFTGTFRNHGGEVDGCGGLTAPLFKADFKTATPAGSGWVFDQQGTDDTPARFWCQYFDCPETDSTSEWLVGGQSFPTYDMARLNGDTNEVRFDPHSTRWCLNGKPGSGLPVEMLHFYVDQVHAIVPVLKWATASEVNSDFFRIESSVDLQSWEALYEIPAQGFSTRLSSYEWEIHEQSSSVEAVRYFRLLQFDADGNFTPYGPVSLQHKSRDMQIFPNPFDGEILIDSKYATMGVITDAQGRIIEKIWIEKGRNPIELSQLKSGVYMLLYQGKTYRLLKN